METSTLDTFISGGLMLIGVLVSQWVIYAKQKTDRDNGVAEARAREAKKDQALYDRLDVIDEKLDLHNDKLDKHNGFEGRIIALETIAEFMQKQLDDSK